MKDFGLLVLYVLALVLLGPPLLRACASNPESAKTADVAVDELVRLTVERERRSAVGRNENPLAVLANVYSPSPHIVRYEIRNRSDAYIEDVREEVSYSAAAMVNQLCGADGPRYALSRGVVYQYAYTATSGREFARVTIDQAACSLPPADMHRVITLAPLSISNDSSRRLRAPTASQAQSRTPRNIPAIPPKTSVDSEYKPRTIIVPPPREFGTPHKLPSWNEMRPSVSGDQEHQDHERQ